MAAVVHLMWGQRVAGPVAMDVVVDGVTASEPNSINRTVRRSEPELLSNCALQERPAAGAPNDGDGSHPIWDPFTLCGQPPIGNPQTTVFYPMTSKPGRVGSSWHMHPPRLKIGRDVSFAHLRCLAGLCVFGIVEIREHGRTARYTKRHMGLGKPQ